MNRQHDISEQRQPDSTGQQPYPVRAGSACVRQMPLLCAALLLIGAMLYGPQLEAWQRSALLLALVLVAGGTGLSLRAVLEARLHPAAPTMAPRPLLRLVVPTPTPERMPPHSGPAAHDGAACAAVTDPITGSYSRHECRQMLAHMFVRASRFRSPLAFVVVQVEQVEQIARLFGPAMADAVLVELAVFLSDHVRGGDVVARWDNAAFALLLPGMTAGEAELLAARLQVAIGPAFFAGFGHLSCGIGLASSCQHASAAALASAASASAAPRRYA